MSIPRGWKVVGLGLCLGAISWLLAATPWGSALEQDVGLGWLFELRGPRSAPSEVVVVAIDHESASALGLPNDPSRWPRDLHARLVSNLARAGASVIAFDLFFGKPEEHDSELARAIANAGNVALVGYLKRIVVSGNEVRETKALVDQVVAPVAVLGESARSIAPFPLPKSTARVDGFWTFMESAGDGGPTFPVAAFHVHALQAYAELASALREATGGRLPDGVPARAEDLRSPAQLNAFAVALRSTLAHDSGTAHRLREAVERGAGADAQKKRLLAALINLHRGGEFTHLNFYGPPRSVRTLAYHEVLGLSPSAAATRADLAGKAIFIGFSESAQPEQRDNYYTIFSQPTGLDLSGVEIAATGFANLLEDSSVRPISPLAALLLFLVWGVALAIAFEYLPPVGAAIALVALVSAFIAAALHEFGTSAHWWPLVIPLCIQAPGAFAWTAASKQYRIRKEREHMRQVFQYYLPSPVIDELVRKVGTVTAGHKLVYGTCLATDAERFTTFSENMDPVRLSELMNDYYHTLFVPVEQHGGFVSNVQGDAMLAIWATPQPDAGLSERACVAALDIARALGELDRASGGTALRTRMGLDCGVMALGSIGAIHHYEYTAMGDIVNTAHRIQALNKRLGTQVLASEAVVERAQNQLLRCVGMFVLEGRSTATKIYEVLCSKDAATDAQRWLCEAFARALERYQTGDAKAAATAFGAILARLPNDGPSRFYLTLCERPSEQPTDPSSRGVVHVAGK